MVWPPQSLLIQLAKMNFCSKAIKMPMDWSEPGDTLKDGGKGGKDEYGAAGEGAKGGVGAKEGAKGGTAGSKEGAKEGAKGGTSGSKEGAKEGAKGWAGGSTDGAKGGSKDTGGGSKA